MKKLVFLIAAFILLTSHDMFLKMDTFYLKPDTISSIHLINGTFEKSDNAITRDRMIDVSLVGHGIRTVIDTTQWADVGETSVLNFKTGNPGTWVAGISTKARNYAQTAEAFNNYLEHDGVLDELDWRKENNALDTDVIEKYSKHVKTIFQVGNDKSGDWSVVLGYPIEFVPLSNPYNSKKGDKLQFRLLWQGNPLANQLVYAGVGSDHSHDHSHEESDDHNHHDAIKLRTDENGIITMNLKEEGISYLRTIYMQHSTEEGLTHESNWATITFQVGQKHTHDDHTDGGHSHDHSHPPMYMYFIMGALLLALIYFLRTESW